MIEFKQVSVDELVAYSDFKTLVDAYIAESGTARLKAVYPDVERYRKLESMGVLLLFVAYEGKSLKGLVSLLLNESLHYDAVLAHIESLFVMPSARKYGTGAKLLKVAMSGAKARQAKGVLMSAPVGSRLAKATRLLGFSHIYNAYYRQVNDE